jgi:hypothetical protein
MSAGVIADIAYAAQTGERPCYYANDHSLDTVVFDPHPMAIRDGRGLGTSLDREGFALIPHASAVSDFEDLDQVGRLHPDEIATLVQSLTGADHVAITGPGVLRFSEKSGRAGALNNSHPARFAHVDVSDATAQDFAARSNPKDMPPRRFAQYNIWRAFSGPPQDVPLALCDARTVEANDLLLADAIFDAKDAPLWSFESWVVAHNPAHAWHWFSDLTAQEVLVFKTHDSDPARAHCVPHVAFDHPACPADAPPRASIEMRVTAYWWGNDHDRNT